jgi:hypothetical protein
MALWPEQCMSRRRQASLEQQVTDVDLTLIDFGLRWRGLMERWRR